MVQLQQQYALMQQEAEKRDGAYRFVQQMIEQGEIELDENDQLQPLNSKTKH